ncbi:hypothetical protein BmR1_04g08270 [Babesia microti strain RI]|uniref:Uncharacterized protein n=1 Tax=Babesia microti (strain RI) TaxID=1133968 RepID=I7J9E2_BABMR|nr:hypothetical protein BmR1_04g08270 [Babesia microti strain RI]CCF75838.1 hypothetical protein BmR1_04g08270 [Babesia microti strain RI]|eukprot:XP_012650246.1 hypothetical protein BmR1_04g08270 [Babesia microti strain RI]
MVEKRRGKATNASSHTSEKLTPNLLTQLEYSQRTVYVEKSVSNACEVRSESDCISLCNISSLGHADSTCESCSIPSEYTDYLLYVKERANIIRTSIHGSDARHRQHKKTRQIEVHESDGGDGSSVDSTGGLVNMRQNVTHLNMCDNPGDMWHGLKTSDGKPVVLHPLKSKHGNRHKQSAFANSGGKKWPSLVKMLQAIRHKNNTVTHDNSGTRNGVNAGDKGGTSTNGPINYSGGFLNINRYIKRTNVGNNTGGGVKKVCGLGKFTKRSGDVGKYDFPMPQHIPKHALKQTMAYGTANTTSNNATGSSTTSGSTANMGNVSRMGHVMGKVGLHKDKSRTGKTEAEAVEKIDMRFKPPKLKVGGRPKQLSKQRAATVTNSIVASSSRAHRKKKRNVSRKDLDTNAAI